MTKSVFEKELKGKEIPITSFLDIAVGKVKEVLEETNVNYLLNLDDIERLREEGKPNLDIYDIMIKKEEVLKAKKKDDAVWEKKIKEMKESYEKQVKDVTSKRFENKLIKSSNSFFPNCIIFCFLLESLF